MCIIQDVADDTSFQAHFDRMRHQPSQDHPQQDQGHDDVHTATEESKQSYTNPSTTAATASSAVHASSLSPTPITSSIDRGRARQADTGHSSDDKVGANASRVYKLRARSTNSGHMDSVLTAHEQVIHEINSPLISCFCDACCIHT